MKMIVILLAFILAVLVYANFEVVWMVEGNPLMTFDDLAACEKSKDIVEKLSGSDLGKCKPKIR